MDKIFSISDENHNLKALLEKHERKSYNKNVDDKKTYKPNASTHVGTEFFHDGRTDS